MAGYQRVNAYQAGKYKASLYPLLFGLAMPVGIGLLKPVILFAFLDSLTLLIICLPVLVVAAAMIAWIRDEKNPILSVLRKITVMPAFVAYGADLKKGGVPWATMGLIVANTVFFLALPESMVKMYVFLPFNEFRVDELVFSFFFSAFLHGGPAHLFFNMLFLWVFGSTIEPRLGWKKFLGLYFLCITASHLVVTVLLALKSLAQDDFSIMTDFHSLGASGAIAGVMGLFLVRCFFARVKFALPMFLVPNLSIPVKVPVMLVIAFFFTYDLVGSVFMFDHNVMTNYWAHAGGYFGGILLAFAFGLQHAAAEESVEVSADRLRQSRNPQRARAVYSDILDKDAENQKGLEYFFDRYKKVQSDQAYTYYARLYRVYRRKSFMKAVKLFSDHYPKYMNALPGDDLLELGIHFYEMADLDKAAWCLYLASKKEGDWQDKAAAYREEVLQAKRDLGLTQQA